MSGRVPAGCVERCPGCPHRGLAAEESAGAKLAFARRSLARWPDRVGGIESPIRRAGYRRRATLRFGRADDGGWELGLLRREGRERVLVPIPECPVHAPELNALAAAARAALAGVEAPLFAWVAQGELATLVVKAPFEPQLADELAVRLRTGLAGRGLAREVYLHFHPSAGDRVFGADPLRAIGLDPAAGPALWAELGHGPASFAQVADELWERAWRRAEEHLRPAPAIADLCCGTGEGLLRWAGSREPGAVVGVELSGEAIAVARARGVPAGALLRGRAGDRVPQLRAWARDRGGAVGVYANPPRTGLEAAVRAWLREDPAVQRLAILSCSPGTLARDLEDLEDGGYGVEAIHAYDFFPQALPVEALALLVRAPAGVRARVRAQ